MIIVCFFLGACSSTPQTEAATTPTIVELTPWVSPTPAPTVEIAPAEAVESIPLPTATPRTHIIEGGEDLGGLALRYQVPLSDILSANPDIDPRAISIGTAIIIPSATAEDSVGLPPVAISGLSVQPALCRADPAGGLSCLAAVKNGADAPVENISLNFILLDTGGSEVASELAYAPLNLLPAGATMPFQVSFSGPLPPTYSVRVDLAGALPGANAPGRYLNHTLEDSAADLASDGLSAQVHGRILLNGDQGDASIAWVLVVGYNASGEVAGFRRWEDSAGIEPGQSRDFNFTLYSAQGRIERVEFLSEVRP